LLQTASRRFDILLSRSAAVWISMYRDLDRRASKNEARERVLELLARLERPTFIGEIALAVCHSWSLEETESLLGQLAREGLLREVLDGRLRRYVRVKSLT
jgi:hypothetical protein